MARKIVCEGCNRKAVKAVAAYGEVWETIKGTPKKDMACDDCGMDLYAAKGDHNCESCGQLVKGTGEGDVVYAGVLIDKKENPVYDRQRPSRWASAYIDEAMPEEIKS